MHRHLLSRRGAVEVRPFDPDLPVFKVGGRMFATTIPSRTPPWLVVKCDPFHSELLRETHAAVRPGYPMNKRHWITVILDGSVPDEEVRDWMDDSYASSSRRSPGGSERPWRPSSDARAEGRGGATPSRESPRSHRTRPVRPSLRVPSG